MILLFVQLSVFSLFYCDRELSILEKELIQDQELSTLEKEVNVLKLEKKKIEIRKAIQEEKDYISKLQVSEQTADKTPLKGEFNGIIYFRS